MKASRIALEAYQKQQDDEKANNKLRAASFEKDEHRTLARMFPGANIICCNTQPSCCKFKIDDLDILVNQDLDFRVSYQILGICPVCKLECWSYPSSKLKHIGKMLVAFEPSREHIRQNHKSESQEYDAIDQLVDALKELLGLED